MTLTQTVQSATGALQRLSDGTPGERGRVAAVVATVLGALQQVLEERQGRQFCLRRAAAEVETLAGGAERAMLKRLLLLLEEADVDRGRLAEALVEYAYALEVARRLPESDAVVALARSLAPGSAEVALHAGRIARKQGDRARALALYREARQLGGGGQLGRLATIGEAVVSAEPEAALTACLAQSLCAQDLEAAGVALEERARVRRAAGERGAAARDLCFAAARFTDPVDRARVAHQLADLFVAADDPYAAREALLLALALGDSSQRDHARGRLHTVSRDVHDQLGMRRWRSARRPALVSLSVRPSAGPSGAPSAAPTIARWRERLAAAAAPTA